MPPAYDLITEYGGSIVVETIEACDEDAAWRAGLMLHIEALMAVVCKDEHDPGSMRAWRFFMTWSDVVIGLIPSGLFLVFPSIPGADLSLFPQLNRELGSLCEEPPAQAIRVSRLYARLVNG